MYEISFNDYNLLDLDSVIESYDVENDPMLGDVWKATSQQLWQEISSYGAGINDYGQVMHGHLERISSDGQAFMQKLGFSAKAGRNFYDAFRLSDIGKLHPDYDVGIWSLPHRPKPEERAEKRLHTERGMSFLDAAYGRLGLTGEMKNHPHLKIVIPALMLFHHERLDGQGYAKKSAAELGKLIRMACIVDAYDGDRILRPHQPAKRTPVETIDRMMATGEDQKYAGAFDVEILEEFRRYKLQV